MLVNNDILTKFNSTHGKLWECLLESTFVHQTRPIY